MKHEKIEVPTTDGVAWVERLTPRQMISIGDRLWVQKRKRLIDDLKDAEIDSEQRVKALSELDKSRGMMSEIISHSIKMDGCLELIGEASKGKNTENADGLPDNFDGSGEDAIRIALSLVGAELDQEDSKKSKKK